jgi:thiol:disulfide interchange protein DsbC
MKRYFPTLFSATLAIAAVTVAALHMGPARAATDASSASADYSAVSDRIKRAFPELTVDSVRPSPMPGLLEIVSGRRIFYSDPTGSYILNGKLIDVVHKVDLTEQSTEDLSKVDPKILPLDDSFAEVRGNGKRQLYVFSDPDCPYCKRLETEFPKLNDVTIHVFLFPLESIHPNARVHAEAIWCAKDRVKAWTSKMKSDEVPPAHSCDTPVDRNLALGEKIGVSATPTLVFADGHIVPGARAAEEIERRLNATN